MSEERKLTLNTVYEFINKESKLAGGQNVFSLQVSSSLLLPNQIHVHTAIHFHFLS